jgi:hypothetical protein
MWQCSGVALGRCLFFFPSLIIVQVAVCQLNTQAADHGTFRSDFDQYTLKLGTKVR